MDFDDQYVTDNLEERAYDLGDFDDAEAPIETDFDDPENTSDALPVYEDEDEDVSYRDENYDYPDDDILDTEDLDGESDVGAHGGSGQSHSKILGHDPRRY